MKKFLLFLFTVILTLSITSCGKKVTKVKIDDVKLNISVYELLPNNLIENSKNQITASNISDEAYLSPVYEKLLDIYQYIDELFIAFERILDQAIDDHNINSGEVYKYKHYEYLAKKEDATIRLNIEDKNMDRVLNVTIKDLPNGNRSYSGIHKVKYDTFSFEFINQKQLIIQFNQMNEDKKSQAMITKDDNIVKTHVVYDEGSNSYELYSIATSDLTSILFCSNKQNGTFMNEFFEIIDKEGNLLYTAFRKDIYKARGWLLNAFNINNIKKINSNEFLVNHDIYYNEPNQTNLHEITIDDKTVYILGKLDYEIIPLIIPRPPFETKYLYIVSNIANATISYYNEINR